MIRPLILLACGLIFRGGVPDFYEVESSVKKEKRDEPRKDTDARIR
jgi:hypothetical protein